MPTPETVDKWRQVCALSDAIARVKKGRGGAEQALELQALTNRRQELQATMRPVVVKG